MRGFGCAIDPHRVSRILTAAIACALLLPAQAVGSQLIDRDAQGLRLAVNARGEALLSYTARGVRKNVLAWGALNANVSAASALQVAFKLDYSGGWGKHRKAVWKSFRNVCKPYAGPPVAWLVVACTAPDGSFWAVQSWQRALHDYGGNEGPWELRLSHWSGPLPVLTIHANWAHQRFDHLFGSFTYLGKPVHGFRSGPTGIPLDGWGRNVYLDTFDSAYGPGWRRESGFLTHVGTGAFCYGLYPHGESPSGKGARYRATVVGPGVTPDISWEGAPLGQYDRELDLRLHDLQRSLYGTDRLCRPV
jgi:hypothetical protein